MAGKSRKETTATPFHPDFPLCAEPRRTPFDGAGKEDAGALFLYLTHAAPHRWTHLIPRDRDGDVAAAALRAFPFLPGSDAALWCFEKRWAVRPSAAAAAARPATAPPPAAFPPRSAPRREWPLMMWVVLADPAGVPAGGTAPRAEVLAFHPAEAAAIADAKKIAEAHGVATVVGLLREDWPWVAPPRKIATKKGPAAQEELEGAPAPARRAASAPRAAAATSKAAAKSAAAKQPDAAKPAAAKRPAARKK